MPPLIFCALRRHGLRYQYILYIYYYIQYEQFVNTCYEKSVAFAGYLLSLLMRAKRAGYYSRSNKFLFEISRIPKNNRITILIHCDVEKSPQ